jgi:hypothetical protein
MMLGKVGRPQTVLASFSLTSAEAAKHSSYLVLGHTR